MSSPPPFPPQHPFDPTSSGERPVRSAFDNDAPASPQAPPPGPFGAAPPPHPFASGPQQQPFGPGPQPPQQPPVYGYQPPPQAPQGYVPYGYAPVAASATNGLAIASMVLGIVGIFLFCFYAIPSILAVIFGGVALNQIKRDPARTSGRGMAIAGVVTGLVGVCLLVLIIAAGNGTIWFN